MGIENFDEAGHRPAANHKGKMSETTYLRGPALINVTLEAWGPKPLDELWATIYNRVAASWGEDPPAMQPTPWVDIDHHHRQVILSAFSGKTLPQVLEMISFHFCIEGVSRACTHQIVRTRIGAGFGQHGGRNNDWRKRPFAVPETVVRASILERENAWEELSASDYQKIYGANSPPVTLKGWGLESEWTGSAEVGTPPIDQQCRDVVNACKRLYARLVDGGIPYQDARRYLPIGLTTYIMATYNYPALSGWLANRLETTMDWEINCVAQLMLRELRRELPLMMTQAFMSHSDRLHKEAFSGMDMFPPAGKWDKRDPRPMDFMFPARSNPFWILSQQAAAGGEIEWIPTNGRWPEEIDEEHPGRVRKYRGPNSAQVITRPAPQMGTYEVGDVRRKLVDENQAAGRTRHDSGEEGEGKSPAFVVVEAERSDGT